MSEVQELPREAIAIQTEAQIWLAQIQSMAITNSAEYNGACELLKQIKIKADALEEQRFAITRPLDQSKKQAMKLFADPTDALSHAERVLKDKILEAYDGFDPVKGISYVTEWKCEITDPDKVPAKYCTPDVKMIADIAKSTKGVIKIPGVKIYCTRSVRARTAE